MVKCRKCGGPHWTRKCDQYQVDTADATPPPLDMKPQKSVRFGAASFDDKKTEDDDDLIRLEWTRQPSLQEDLSPSLSLNLEIEVHTFLARVQIYGRSAISKRAVQSGHVRVVLADGMSKVCDETSRVGKGSELLIERSPWLSSYISSEIEGETLCIIVRDIPQYDIERDTACLYFEVNKIFDSLQMDNLEHQKTSDIVKGSESCFTEPKFSPKKSRFTVLLEEDFVRGSRQGSIQELDGTTEGGVQAVGTRNHRVVAKKQEADASTPVSKRHGDGFLIGEEVVRERAAYLLDKRHRNFSNVPPTALARVEVGDQTKTLSIQKYREANDSTADYGPGFFSKVQPLEIQKIGILDIRLFNTDRHGGNILWKCKNQNQRSFAGPDKTTVLIPIDHGGCLPDYCHLNRACFDWINWTQASMPWTAEALEHIEKLNPVEDAEILRRKLHIRESCVLTLIICTIVLKESVLKHNFSLREVGSFILDDSMDESSGLSRIIDQTLEKLGLPKPELASEVTPPPDGSAFLHVFMDLLTEALNERKSRAKIQTEI